MERKRHNLLGRDEVIKWVRNINSTMDWHEHERYMYENQLKQLISQEMWDLCMAEIHRVKELSHVKVMNRQISKFEKLLQQNNCKDQCGHSKHDQNGWSNQDGLEITTIVPKKWVINLSSTPPTQELESLLSHGPNFAVTPKNTIWGVYHSHWISLSTLGWHYSGGIKSRCL